MMSPATLRFFAFLALSSTPPAVRPARTLSGGPRPGPAFWSPYGRSICQALDGWSALRLGVRYVARRELERWQSTYGAIPSFDTAGRRDRLSPFRPA